MTTTLAETVRPGLDLSLSLDLQASRTNLWRCWTEGTLLRRWFAPEPWSVTRAELDVRPGGTMQVTMCGPEGEENAGSSVYLEVVPEQRLVWTMAFSEAWIPSDNPFMVAIIAFGDLPDGSTRYEALVRHWTSEACDQHSEMGFEAGWTKCARQLEALAQTLAEQADRPES